MSTRDDDACHKPRQAVQLETVRLGGVVGRHDFVRSTNFAFLIGNLARLLAQMSFDHSSKSKHWLERAAEVRTIAASIAEDGIKASILRLANDYDKLAARASARANAEDVHARHRHLPAE